MKCLPLYLLDLLKSISDMQGVAGMMPLAHMENSKQEAKSMGRQLGGGESKTQSRWARDLGSWGSAFSADWTGRPWIPILCCQPGTCALVRAGKWPALVSLCLPPSSSSSTCVWDAGQRQLLNAEPSRARLPLGQGPPRSGSTLSPQS